MARTVVGLYDHFEDAQQVARELIDRGIPKDNISLIANDVRGEYSRKDLSGSSGQEMKEGAAKGAGAGAVVGGLGGLLVGLGALTIPGIGPVLAAGPIAAALGGAGIGAAAGGLIGALTKAGIPEEQAHMYAEGVRRGGTLVMVRADDNQTDRVAEIMNRHNAVNVNERATHWRKDRWQRFDQSAQPYTEKELNEINVPIIQEEMKVGKRQVEQGGVRVSTYVTEQPVEHDIHLRDEQVNVERRPADRSVDPNEIGAFKEGSMEMRETHEEPMVHKEARVVEDVNIRKDVTERDETIRDSVRRQDVNVENLQGEGRQGYKAFDSLEPTFRQDFERRYMKSGHPYHDYQLAYRYGYDQGTSDRYQNRNWSDIEPELRRDWERERRDTPWEEFKDAVRTGWESIRSNR